MSTPNNQGTLQGGGAPNSQGDSGAGQPPPPPPPPPPHGQGGQRLSSEQQRMQHMAMLQQQHQIAAQYQQQLAMMQQQQYFAYHQQQQMAYRQQQRQHGGHMPHMSPGPPGSGAKGQQGQGVKGARGSGIGGPIAQGAGHGLASNSSQAPVQGQGQGQGQTQGQGQSQGQGKGLGKPPGQGQGAGQGQVQGPGNLHGQGTLNPQQQAHMHSQMSPMQFQHYQHQQHQHQQAAMAGNAARAQYMAQVHGGGSMPNGPRGPPRGPWPTRHGNDPIAKFNQPSSGSTTGAPRGARPQSSSATRPSTRKKSALQIIDPKTGKPIVIGGAQDNDQDEAKAAGEEAVEEKTDDAQAARSEPQEAKSDASESAPAPLPSPRTQLREGVEAAKAKTDQPTLTSLSTNKGDDVAVDTGATPRTQLKEAVRAAKNTGIGSANTDALAAKEAAQSKTEKRERKGSRTNALAIVDPKTGKVPEELAAKIKRKEAEEAAAEAAHTTAPLVTAAAGRAPPTAIDAMAPASDVSTPRTQLKEAKRVANSSRDMMTRSLRSFSNSLEPPTLGADKSQATSVPPVSAPSAAPSSRPSLQTTTVPPGINAKATMASPGPGTPPVAGTGNLSLRPQGFGMGMVRLGAGGAAAVPPTAATASSGAIQPIAGKHIYTVLQLLEMRKVCKELPASAQPMEVDMNIESMPVQGRGRPGGGGGGQWSRGRQMPNGGRQGGGGGGGQWSRGQAPPRGQKGGGGGGGNFRPLPPLKRGANAWQVTKAKSAIENCERVVRSALNKMTREGFERLAETICKVPIDSVEQLRLVVRLVFDKALELVSFADLYADLSLRLSEEWARRQNKETRMWKFVRFIESTDDGSWFWVSEDECMRPYKASTLIGPFEEEGQALGAALAEDAPLVGEEQADGEDEPEYQLCVVKLSICEGRYIRVMRQRKPGASPTQLGAFYGPYYCESGPPSMDQMKEIGQELQGPFASAEDCRKQASKVTSFKRLMLNMCQEAFEENTQAELAGVDDKREGESDKECEQRRVQRKGRVIGNIRFIGELYKKDMLQERIMHECVGKLLRMEVEYKTPLVRPNWREKYPDDEDVECCCKLLASTGPRLDVKREQDMQLSKRHRSREGAPAGLSIIGLYFHVLGIISSDKRTNARIRFMVMDLIEMRANRWQARREELTSKTKEEVRKDFARAEQREQQRERQMQRSGAKGGRQVGRDARGQQGRGQDARGQRGGQDLRSQRGGEWQRTTTGGAGRGGQQPGSLRIAPRPQKGGRDHGSRSETHAGREPPSTCRREPHSSRDSGNSARNARISSTDGSSSATAAAAASVLDRETAQRKVKGILGEFQVNKDIKEAAECTKELMQAQVAGESVGALLVETLVDRALNGKAPERAAVGSLLEGLAADATVLTPAHVVAGVGAMCEFLADVAIDCPQAFAYIGTLLAPLLVHGNFPDAMAQLSAPSASWHAGFIEDEFTACGGKFFCAVAAAVSTLAGEDKLRDLASDEVSGFSISRFLPSGKRGKADMVAALQDAKPQLIGLGLDK